MTPPCQIEAQDLRRDRQPAKRTYDENSCQLRRADEPSPMHDEIGDEPGRLVPGSHRIAQKTRVQPSRRACSVVYDTPSTFSPSRFSRVMIPPAFPNCTHCATLTTRVAPGDRVPPSRCLFFRPSASCQPVRSTGSGEALSSVTVFPFG